jgi:hypothetical protein
VVYAAQVSFGLQVPPLPQYWPAPHALTHEIICCEQGSKIEPAHWFAGQTAGTQQFPVVPPVTGAPPVLR